MKVPYIVVIDCDQLQDSKLADSYNLIDNTDIAEATNWLMGLSEKELRYNCFDIFSMEDFMFHINSENFIDMNMNIIPISAKTLKETFEKNNI